MAYNVERLQNGDTDNLIDALFKSKKMEIFMSAVLLLAVTLVACNMDKVAEVESKKCIESEKRDKVVVIDPGHGGEDPGKVGVNKAKEKDVNLEISKELRSVLIKAGFDVVMTRENDESLGAGDRFSKIGDLNKRCEIINNTYVENNNCVLISIHQNSFTQESVHGAQSFYYQRSEESKRLAELVQQELNVGINTEKEKKEKPNDSYYMLINSKCPGIIVECGFLSNNKEAANLVDEKYQKEISKILCRGIVKYFDKK